jgi:hypothetical protein
MNKESLEIEKKKIQAIGAEISHDLAGKMIKDHHDKHSFENSYSYVIGKDMIDQVLAQPGCVGLRFFDAINEVGAKTLVYAGVDEKGKSIVELTAVDGHGKLAATPAMIGDNLDVNKPVVWTW